MGGTLRALARTSRLRGPATLRRAGAGGARGADHRAFRPPGFLESCRKYLWARCALAGVVPPAGVEVGGRRGLVALRLSPLFLLLFPRSVRRSPSLFPTPGGARDSRSQTYFSKEVPLKNRTSEDSSLKIKKVVETSLLNFSSPTWLQSQESL